MPHSLDRRQFIISSGAATGLAASNAGRLLAAPNPVAITALRADYIEMPLGLESPRPHLSWRVESALRDVRQVAYRIVVSSDEARRKNAEGDLWDSNKVLSAKSFSIEYCGRPLMARQRCWWRVEVWTNVAASTSRSDWSWWEMGLLSPADWSASWLSVQDRASEMDRRAGLCWIWGDPRQDAETRAFRRSFTLDSPFADGGKIMIARHGFTRVANVYIDGESLVPPTHVLDVDPPSHESRWLELPALPSGNHVIAIEIAATKPFAKSDVDSQCVRGIAAFLRIPTARFKSVSWKTCIEPQPGWHNENYDDSAWGVAVPLQIEGYEPWPPEPAMHLRKEFVLREAPVKARLYATALGAYEARLNGRRVGDALLTPEPAQYAKRVLYQVYDVTHMLSRGPNAVGFTVGDGWYASFNSFSGRYTWDEPPRRLLAQLEIEFADGSRDVLATGPDWHTAESAIQRSEVRIGEIYDARLEQVGWDTHSFDDSQWRNAMVANAPDCHLTAQVSPPIRATSRLPAIKIFAVGARSYMFDFGQQFAGWCRLRLRGARGTRVELRFGELLNSNGEIEQRWLSMGEPKIDVYILKGTGEEVFEPHFCYRGFRYVHIVGIEHEPTLETLEGIRVHSDLTVSGEMFCSAPRIKDIWHMAMRSQTSNFVGVPTDCPSREQLGYLGDAGVFWDAASFNMDVCAFTSRYMQTVVDDQADDGAFSIAAPLPRFDNAFFRTSGSPPGWGDAAIILPWTIWQRYGDVSIARKHWAAMTRHLNFILDHNPNYLWEVGRSRDFGDWFSPEQLTIPDPNPATPKKLIGTAYWAYSARLLAEMGQVLAMEQEAARLRTVAERVREAFNKAFVTADGKVGSGSQTCQTLALKFELLPEAIRRKAAARLADDIELRGGALSTGFLGTQFILDVLVDYGFAALAYSLLLRDAYPSWGHMISKGATNLWENWSGEIDLDGKKYQLSRNHYALGAVCGFLFRRVLGIAPGKPGFEVITVRPIMDSRLESAGGHYDSIVGRISTNWRRVANRFDLEVTIPANTTAYIHLPSKRSSQVLESGTAVKCSKDIAAVDQYENETVVKIGSGQYRFSVIG